MKPTEVVPTADHDFRPVEAGQIKPDDKAEVSDVSGGCGCPWPGRQQPPYTPRHRKALDLASLGN